MTRMTKALMGRMRGSMLGLAVGDAVGAAVEFSPRGSFDPVTDMIGGGPFGLQPGEWTDDTSMALCLATSLVETGGFDAQDQMERYCRWREEGYLSSNGRCFDIGGTVSRALARFRETGEAMCGSTDPHTAGNGSLVRLAPIALFYHPESDDVRDRAAESSQTTHGAEECVESCRYFADRLGVALAGSRKEKVLSPIEGEDASWLDTRSEGLLSVVRGEYQAKSDEDIRGAGYVVDCLEAAMWCVHRGESYEETILLATNLGDDADSTAAVAGQLAGALYGEKGIPKRWLELISHREMIADLADRLASATPNVAD